MRGATLVLSALFVLVQAQLWFGPGSVPKVMELRRQVADQEARNESARLENERLLAEVQDLQQGLEMVEGHARGELGMVKPNEILVKYSGSVR